jgi:catechol 2,3-dioxygenase-like lactoylglutathione lyase family enzyme
MPLATLNPIAFIPTNNPEAARSFYETTLGLTFISDDNFALVFRIGPTQTMLRVVRTGAFTPAQFTIFGWETPDIEPEVKALTAKGIDLLRFPFFQQDALGIWTAPNGNKVAWFKDPDGNTLSLSSH